MDTKGYCRYVEVKNTKQDIDEKKPPKSLHLRIRINAKSDSSRLGRLDNLAGNA